VQLLDPPANQGIEYAAEFVHPTGAFGIWRGPGPPTELTKPARIKVIFVVKFSYRVHRLGLDQIESVYRREVDALRGVAAAIVQDRDEGCDVVQEAFAKAIRRRRSFRGNGSVEGWLWRIVVNTALDHRQRSLEARRAIESYETDLSAAEANERFPLALERAIAALPERQRLTLFLRYYADLDYQTIAETLGVARGTVSATLSAAHRAVRAHLQEVTP